MRGLADNFSTAAVEDVLGKIRSITSSAMFTAPEAMWQRQEAVAEQLNCLADLFGLNKLKELIEPKTPPKKACKPRKK